MPPLMAFGGQWPPYEDALYAVFVDTILNGGLTFRGLRVSARQHPEYKGRHAAFWHLISEGRVEDDREPCMRRCERLRWIAWMIANAPTCTEIVIWSNQRGQNRHVVLMHTEARYVVVLAVRQNHFLLVSAYPVRGQRRYDELWSEYENSRGP